MTYEYLGEYLGLEATIFYGFPTCLAYRIEQRVAKYGKSAQRSVERAMHKLKKGGLKSGKSGKRVKNREQAIAIGLSEARHKGARQINCWPASQGHEPCFLSRVGELRMSPLSFSAAHTILQWIHASSLKP